MSDNNSTSLEEFVAIVESEERRDKWDKFFAQEDSHFHKVSEEYRILHRPYTNLLSDVGMTLLTYVSNPQMSGVLLKAYEEACKLILQDSGVVRFDQEQGVDWISLVLKLVSEAFTGNISTISIENRLREHTDNALVVVLKALRLPDGDPAVGLDHEELRNLAAYLQAYKIAKERGLDELRTYAGQLRNGEILDYTRMYSPKETTN